MKLEVKNLNVEIDDKKILNGIDLEFAKGKIVVIMGPNGSGKSTLANALMGNPKYKITKGKIILDNKDITKETPDVRAKLGLFMSFQHPKEIHGVTANTMLRTVINKIKNTKMSVLEFNDELNKKMKELNLDESFKKRYLNVGFSGGEKKRMEILQLAMLNPSYAILDEIDSGLDVDALKIVCAGINKVKKDSKNKLGLVIITHYNNILKYLHPDEVHIMYKGKIVKSGSNELAKKIANNGFNEFIKQN